MTLKNSEKIDETRDGGPGREGASPVDTGNPHANRKADQDIKAPEPGSVAEIPAGPIDTGNPQANRKADKVTKSSMLKEMINTLSGMSSEELAVAMSTLTTESEKVDTVSNASAVIAEDLTSIFGSLNLSESAINKATIVFEAAVGAKVATRYAELTEEFDKKLEEAAAQNATELENAVDRYLSLVAEEWVKENQVAIETGLRMEFAESFITSLKNVFEEHYVSIPEDKVDVVEALTQEVTEAGVRINKLSDQLIESSNQLKLAQVEQITKELSEGLSVVEKDRFVKLVENVSFDTADQFREKATAIRESVERAKPVSDPDVGLTEAVSATVTSTAKPTVELYESPFDTSK